MKCQNNVQWHNRGGRVPPRNFWPRNFCWPIGKKEARKKGKRGENWREKKENCKREGENLKMEGEGGKVTKWGEDLFFSFFFFFASHFSKPLLGQPKWNSRKKHFMLPGAKNQKKWLPPQKIFFPLMPLIMSWRFCVGNSGVIVALLISTVCHVRAKNYLSNIIFLYYIHYVANRICLI